MTDDFHTLTPWAHALVDLLAGVGMLLIVPLGLSLVATPGAGAAFLRRWWLAVALPAAISLWLPRGLLTATLATPYLTATAILLIDTLQNYLVRPQQPPTPPAPPGQRVNTRRPTDSQVAGPQGSGRAGRERDFGVDGGRRAGASGVPNKLAFEVAFFAALSGPLIGAGALVAERAGDRLFGFGLDTLTLTSAHFLYAGFAAALVAALLADRRPGTVTTIAAWCVPGGTVIVLVGYFTGDPVELAGAAVLTAGMWLVGWATWRESRDPGLDRLARALLVTSASVLVVTMVLALDWAVGEVTGLPHLPLSWMAATHGLANALGFALCALLAWSRIGVADADVPSPNDRTVATNYEHGSAANAGGVARPARTPGGTSEAGTPAAKTGV